MQHHVAAAAANWSTVNGIFDKNQLGCILQDIYMNWTPLHSLIGFFGVKSIQIKIFSFQKMEKITF